ncbi:MAG: transposase [Eggerthellaceae bacterium]|nr:transposase [Eggerthellaceae bacterium]
MPRRELSETGCYHIVTRSAGKTALFEDDEDRREFCRLLRDASKESSARILAWVLMTDHVHMVADFGERPDAIIGFMYQLNKAYSCYFNAKTGREGHLLQSNYWSKPIDNDAQLIATVYYIHRNPEAAGVARMREYPWSSYREYAGNRWLTDTSTVLGLFGSFESFDRYEGSSSDVVRQFRRGRFRDDEALALALQLSGYPTSGALRSLSAERRDAIALRLHEQGVPQRMIARVMGMGPGTVSRVLKQQSVTKFWEQ